MNPPRPLVVLFPPPKKKKGNKQTPMTKPNKKIKNKNTHTHKINRWKKKTVRRERETREKQK